MADLVAPFQGERYAATDRLSALIAPPYDVIDQAERARYAALDADNIVHVMLPEALRGRPEEDRYRVAAERLAAWRRGGVLKRDPQPALYVLAQDFTLPTGERRTRRGVFAAVTAEGYEPRRIRPHERTHAGPKADRLALMRATATNIESIFLLAPDRDGTLANAIAAASSGKPDATAELNGVGIRLWIVRDVSRFPFPDSPLYIADGHHRYETASAYALENPAADRVLALIVSAQDPGLAVLPTHRVIFGTGRELERILTRWREWFDVQSLAPDLDPVAALASLGRDRTACLVADRSRTIALLLKTGVLPDRLPSLAQSAAVRDLDVARIESLVVKEILGAGTTTPIVRYVADAREALGMVRQGGAAMAVLLNPTKVEQVFAVADAGDVMPPKSTYFIPKVPSGLVLRPLS
ncbi:MAG TPA: DUF1015 domain-containing protein [Gemmatimonadales bacterium]|jgi:uncharacterized protein (DUF1015 family)|nr:DUF1015 domain-containing protein [Gemmatimonadales bacterium]